jgi:hypothetical protein
VFPPTTQVVVGPGVQVALNNGIAGPHASITDLNGRSVEEIAFDENSLRIGGLRAYDYFGDGSFYLLEAPGVSYFIRTRCGKLRRMQHCVGHILGFARTTAEPASFILMAGDVCHHPAQLRPSPHSPLPSALEDNVPAALAACARKAPFLAPSKSTNSVHQDSAEAAHTLELVQAFDARPDVLTLIAHDGSVDFMGGFAWFPDSANEWMQKGWKERLFWAFLDAGNPSNRWE